MKNKINKVLAIVPARSGSKGIPKKNIYPLAGKPLLSWTVEAALRSKYIDRVIVSSDDKKILQLAEKFGAESIKRPKSIAKDDSPFSLLIRHALDWLKKKENYVPDLIVYLQPTSPLRNSKDIDKAFSLLKGRVNSVISVYEIDNKFLKSFVIERNGTIKGAVNNKFPFTNRQKLPKTYMPNGAIYIVERDFFQRTGGFFSPKTIPFVMSKEKSLDIDSLEDLKKAEEKLDKKKKNTIK